MKRTSLLVALTLAALAGCHHHGGDDCYGEGNGYGAGRRGYRGVMADRPFPLGQVSDSHWEIQQTNAEAADFIFYDHEFKGNTAELSPGAKKHLMQVALRLEHVPFPVVIEESPGSHSPTETARRQALDMARRQTIVEQLARLGAGNIEERVIVANAFPEGYTGIESEGSYYNVIGSGFGGGAGRRFGGMGGMYQ
jgi:hypothetical protein